tara:strand:- start:782 stop:1219 length:438 start_codon:yes stop_codon:yes gene_type:complete
MINKVILIGNVGTDPEVRTFDSGRKKASFALATSKRWTSKDGEDREETQWHNIECWGRDADYVGEFISKGARLYIEGKIEYRTFEKDDGQKSYFTSINAGWPDGSIKILNKKGGNAGEAKSDDSDEIDLSKDIPTVDFGDLPPVD